MTRIAIDAMGGDHAPFEIVAGAVWAASEYGVALELVGKQDQIEECLEKIQKDGFMSPCGKASRSRRVRVDIKPACCGRLYRCCYGGKFVRIRQNPRN